MASASAAHPPMPEQHPERHEPARSHLRIVIGLVVGVVICAALMHLGLYWLFGLFDRRDNRVQPPLTAVQQAPLSSPEPRLQGIPDYHPNTPTIDLAQMREHNASVLNNYGPSTEPGFVRIPIGRAMELVVEKDLLASQTQPTTVQTGGTNAPK
jgi:hypothetical protein